MFNVKVNTLNIKKCYLRVKMLLKKIILVFSILIVSNLYTQNINQLDADGNRHGIWKKTHDGTKQLRYEGSFEHGQEVGVFNFYDKAGGHPTAVKRYTTGSTTLDVSFYTISGKKVSEGQMVGRLREGNWKFYHQDGKSILSTEHYVNGLIDGEKLEYYISGVKALEETYKKGKREGLAIYYTEDNTLLKELTYKDDRLEGPAKLYDALGNLIKEGTYRDNKKNGIWKYYENSKMIKKVRFPQNKIGVEH